MTPGPTRAFGRFGLKALVGKSLATMVWLAHDPRNGAEVMLTLPRDQPQDTAALAEWLERARRAARLEHPNLAPVEEIGVNDHWPFVAVARSVGITLAEWFGAHPPPATVEVGGWLCDALLGLAYAHEAGIAHGDVQLQNLLIDDRGRVRVMALAAHGGGTTSARRARGAGSRGMAMDPALLRDQREGAERDVLACGVLLHHLLAGEPALGLADTGQVIARLTPLGRDTLRLPWTSPLPVADALRAIANRATSPQERLRYRGARTLLGALGGWLAAESQDNGGPVALLLDRLHSVGHLPALPGLAARVARLIASEGKHTDAIAGQILPDLALSFELLRTLNTAQVQGTQVPGNGTVLTLRRIVALIGVNGVRKAANALRTWPGALDDAGAARLKKTMERIRLAGHVAQALRPAGYDAEVVYLITVMQSLGRVLVRYHFADEAEQIDNLMQSPEASDGAQSAEAGGLSEDAAAYAVLGVDIAAFGFAVARHWGLGDEVLHMIRRLPLDAPVRKPDSDVDLLRILGSAANETIDAVTQLPAARVGLALERIAERYARVLRIGARSLHDAIQEGRDASKKASVVPVRKPPTEEPIAPAELAR